MIRRSLTKNTVLTYRLSRRGLLKRGAALGMSASAIASLLAACGGDNDDDGGDAAQPTATASDGGQTADPTATAAPSGSEDPTETPEPQQSGRSDAIIAQFTEESAGYTTIWRSDVVGAQIADQIFEPLTRVHDYEALELEPGLALEWAQEDDVTYVFKLREGVRFHEGYGEMTAEDAAWSYNIAIETIGRGGLRSFIDMATARDRYTVEIKMLQPFGGFIPAWSHVHYSAVHSQAAYEEMGQDEYNRRAIGTGPFRLESWDQGVSTTLRKFEDYWDPERPKLDELTFLPVSDPFVKLERLRAGEVDFTDAVDFKDLPGLEGEAWVNVLSPPNDEWDYISFNLRVPEDHPIQMQEVRQAIGYAINRNEIVDLVYGGFANAEDDPFIPGMPGDDPDTEFYPPDGDPDRARELLEQAGYADGFEVPCITSAKPELRQLLELVAGQLADVGITIQIQNLDSGTFNQIERTDFAHEMSLEDISLAGPDADPTIYQFFHSDQDTYSNFSDPDLDELLVEARVATDFAERNDLYREAMQIVYEASPMLYLTQPRQIYLLHPNLAGFRPGRTEFNIYMDEMFWEA